MRRGGPLWSRVLFIWLPRWGNTITLAPTGVDDLFLIGRPPGSPNRHQPKKSPSASVGAGVDEDVGLGRLRRPRPCSSHFHLAGTRPPSTPRATIKALPTPHRPPSPLRSPGPLPDLPASVDASWVTLVVAHQAVVQAETYIGSCPALPQRTPRSGATCASTSWAGTVC